MANPNHIDPIKVREEQRRQTTWRDSLGRSAQAGEALLWFAETGKDETSIDKVKAPVVASSTPYAAQAQAYIDRAAQKYRAQIYEEAVRLAQMEFDAGKKIGPRDNG